MNYTCVRGDQFDLEVTITENDGTTAVDLTGATAVLTVKKSTNDATAVISKTGTHTTPTSGITSFSLLTTDTATAGRYVYDIQVTFSDGKILSSAVGDFLITEDVT